MKKGDRVWHNNVPLRSTHLLLSNTSTPTVGRWRWRKSRIITRSENIGYPKNESPTKREIQMKIFCHNDSCDERSPQRELRRSQTSFREDTGVYRVWVVLGCGTQPQRGNKRDPIKTQLKRRKREEDEWETLLWWYAEKGVRCWGKYLARECHVRKHASLPWMTLRHSMSFPEWPPRAIQLKASFSRRAIAPLCSWGVDFSLLSLPHSLSRTHKP